MIFKWNHNIKLPNLEFLGYHSEITQQKKDPKGLSNRSSSSSLGFVFPKRKKFFQNVYIFSTSAIDQGCHTFETPSFGFSKLWKFFGLFQHWRTNLAKRKVFGIVHMISFEYHVNSVRGDGSNASQTIFFGKNPTETKLKLQKLTSSSRLCAHCA